MADTGRGATKSSCETGDVETSVKKGLSVPSGKTTPWSPVQDDDWPNDELTRSRRDKTRGVLFAVLMLVVMAGVGSFLVADIAHLLDDQDLLVRGDIVLLRSNASSLWYRKLTFSLRNANSSLPANGSVRLFQTPCDDLHMHLETENLLYHSEPHVFFNNCPSTDGKHVCVLDQFIYLVDSNVTAVQYKINLPSNYSSSSVNITVFNSHYNFDDYLNGGSNIPVVNWSSLSENFTFDLNRLPNSSYYFLTIEAWNETVEWFNFTRRGRRALYNVSDLEPACVMTTDECLISDFQSDRDNCFLAELPGESPSGAPSNSDLVFVAYDGDIVGTAIFIVSLVLCVLVFLSAVCAAALCFGCDKMQPGQWPYRLSRQVKYSKIQQQ